MDLGSSSVGVKKLAVQAPEHASLSMRFICKLLHKAGFDSWNRHTP